jgi:hypothetical protein
LAPRPESKYTSSSSSSLHQLEHVGDNWKVSVVQDCPDEEQVKELSLFVYVRLLQEEEESLAETETRVTKNKNIPLRKKTMNSMLFIY